MKKFSVLLAMLMALFIAVPAMAGTKADGNQVTFTFKAPDAATVFLSGNFNGWSPTGDKMTKGEDGVWSVTIKLKPNTYQYKFVVDGKWIQDPEVAASADDGNGGKNSVLIVKAPGASDSGANSAQLNALEAKVAALEQSQKANGFSFHGYARTGILLSDGKQVTNGFWPSDAWAHYRLGNEADTFIESTLEKTWTRDDGSYAKVHFLWCNQSYPNGSNWEAPYVSSNPSSSYQDTTFFMRESYAELGNLPDLGNLTFWAGERYYRRDDIHLLDYYWRDFSGLGAGVEGIKIGDAKLAMAYIAHSGKVTNDYTYTYDSSTDTWTATDASNDLLKNSLVLSLTDIKLGPGNLDLDFAYSTEKADTDLDSSAEDGSGPMLTAKYSLGSFFGLTEGSSMVGFAYSSGLDAYGLSVVSTNPNNNENTTVIKLLTSGIIQVNDSFEIQPVLVYLNQKNDDWSMDTTWKSIGCRPIYHFNKNFALQFEAGYDIVSYKSGSDNKTSKYTIAPTITIDKGYYVRPQVRAFLTRCNPDGDDSYNLYGVQMEAWW